MFPAPPHPIARAVCLPPPAHSPFAIRETRSFRSAESGPCLTERVFVPSSEPTLHRSVESGPHFHTKKAASNTPVNHETDAWPAELPLWPFHLEGNVCVLSGLRNSASAVVAVCNALQAANVDAEYNALKWKAMCESLEPEASCPICCICIASRLQAMAETDANS